MFRKNLTVVYKPIKNNTVILPDNYYQLLNTHDNGCLCLSFDKITHYISWAPYGNSLNDFEIGINSIVATAIGLKEGTLVKCSLVPEVMVLDSVNVTTVSQRDWQMLDASSYRIQSTVLDQTRIVNNGQFLIVWINRAMSITLKIESLKPNVSYGKLANNTQLIVAPYVDPMNSVQKKQLQQNEPLNNNKYSNDIKSQKPQFMTTQELIDKYKIKLPPLTSPPSSPIKTSAPLTTSASMKPMKSASVSSIIDSRTLQNCYSTSAISSVGSVGSSSAISTIGYISNGGDGGGGGGSSSSSSSISTSSSASSINDTYYNNINYQKYNNDNKKNYDNNINNNNNRNNHNIDRNIKKLTDLMEQLKKQSIKTFQFRVIPNQKWESGQLPDLYLTEHNLPEYLDTSQIFRLMKTTSQINDHTTEHPPAPANSNDTDSENGGDKSTNSSHNDYRKNGLIEPQQDYYREYFVNIKIITDNCDFPRNRYPTIELNEILMKQLNIKPLEKILLKSKATVLNLIERIDLYPNRKTSIDFKTMKNIEFLFKQYVIENTKLYPLLLNQNQIFRLKDDLYVTICLYPESFRYCLIDSDALKDCQINCMDTIKDLSGIFMDGKDKGKDKNKSSRKTNKEDDSGGDGNGHSTGPGDDNTFEKIENFVKLTKFESIIEKCTEEIILNLCLDERNVSCKMGNFILIGSQNTGKSTICNKIISNLSVKPYYCYWEIFPCSRHKGRKPDSIQKDLRQVFTNGMKYSPSVIILDNLDILTQNVIEHTQEGEYYNRISDIIQHLILEYTKDNPIVVIATVTNKNKLNKRIYASRGRHLFQNIIKIPDLEKTDRQLIIEELIKNIKQKKLNFNKFANLTEGYNIGDLVQFIERSIFYAFKISSKTPKITNEILLESLKTTNSYCLHGINDNTLSTATNSTTTIDINDEDDKENCGLSGLENVLTVLEEVLMWPSKFPTIFEHSPLRNQAGVLLFGPPGVGKTYLISELARNWHLRMISVKGPELLAKFIGQSEENVRNLFDRARSAKPCVLFFDEFDSLAPRRGHDSTGVTDRVVNQLLTELDGVEGLQGVVVIAATSRPELLDPALLRSGRIDRLVECTLPNRTARINIFKKLANSLHLDKSVNFEYFADKTDGYTGADIQSILTSANMIAVNECLKNDSENIPKKIFITQKHLQQAFDSTRPSLSTADILRYQQMYTRFTNKEKQSARDFVAKRATLA